MIMLRYLNYYWNLLATYYCPNIELSFNRVNHICRDGFQMSNISFILRLMNSEFVSSFLNCREERDIIFPTK